MTCKNCDCEVNSKFCPDCGQPINLKRIDGKYIIHEIEHVLHFERGILFTIRELITNPGQNIKNYLTENRSRLVKPVIFIIITSLIYSSCNHFFHIEENYTSYLDAKKSTTAKIYIWIQGHYGYANILMGAFIALTTKMFFRKHNYNFFEILILLCYVMGIEMLIFSVLGIVQGVTHTKLMKITATLGFAYATWAIGQFFGKNKVINYVKAFIAYIFGMAAFYLTATLIGKLIDLTIHQ